MRRLGGLALACALVAPLAAAQSAEDKATARRLAIEGMNRADANDCAAALPLLAKAESLFHAPLHLHYTARCLVRAGRLVEAVETWRRVVRETPPPDASPIVREAFDEAQREIGRVEARLGTVVVHVASPYPGLVVSLDQTPLAAASLDVPRVVDPGHHRLIARADGYREGTQMLDVAEGARVAVTITLQPAENGAPPPPASSTSVAPPVPSAPPAPPPTGSLHRPAAITAAAGGALVSAAVVTWLVRNAKRDRILADCPSLACTTDHADEKASVERWTAATNVLLVTGVVAIATGVTLWTVAGSGDGARATARVLPSPSGGALAVEGAF